MNRASWLVLCAALGFGGCHSSDKGGGNGNEARTALFAVSEGDEMVGFFADTPRQFLSRVQITGIVVDDPSNPPFALAMDIRPSDRRFYLLQSDYRLYTIDPANGSATLVGRALAELGDESIDIRAMDFDSATEQLRLLDGATGESYRVSAANAGLIAQDTTLAYVAGDPNEGRTVFPVGLSYDGPGDNGERTAYVLDQFNDVLARLGLTDDTGSSAQGGQLTTIADWGFELSGGGFSVESRAAIGYVVETSVGSTEQTDLLRIDLTDASSTNLGRIGNESQRFVILAHAVVPGTGAGQPQPTPSPTPGPSASPTPSPSPSPSPGATPSPSPSPTPGDEHGPLTQQCIDEGTGAGFPEDQVVLFCTTVFGPLDDV